MKELAKRINYHIGCVDIFNHFGESKQLLQLIQECSELIKAITKGDRENFIEELADVSVMIDQITLKYPDIAARLPKIKAGKVYRTLERISQEGK
jgi:NTP pyrophosphatase (non-canonical NTP hydrolase)